MKANELRIGNLVNYHIVDSLDERKEWDEVSIIDADDIKILDENPDDESYSPIPLTGEILLKCCFKKTEEGYESIINGFRICLSYGKYLMWCHYDDKLYLSIDDCYGIGSPIEYLHQLQNLVFVLTGEELNVEQLLNQ